jgi:hypothetical protein
MLVPLRAVSDPSGWPLSRVKPVILQEEATESRQSTEAGIIHNIGKSERPLMPAQRARSGPWELSVAQQN